MHLLFVQLYQLYCTCILPLLSSSLFLVRLEIVFVDYYVLVLVDEIFVERPDRGQKQRDEALQEPLYAIFVERLFLRDNRTVMIGKESSDQKCQSVRRGASMRSLSNDFFPGQIQRGAWEPSGYGQR